MANVMQKIEYGLFILTSRNKSDNGCIVNTVNQISTVPESVCVSVTKSSYTNEMIRESGKFCVSILTEEAPFDLFVRFGFQSGRDVDKFDGFSDVKRTASGLYYLDKYANAYLEADVKEMFDEGSHTLFVADITDMAALSDVASATYSYYHRVIKPKPENKNAKGWRCTVCNYEYTGDTLPADFVCPICGHSAADFERIQ